MARRSGQNICHVALMLAIKTYFLCSLAAQTSYKRILWLRFVLWKFCNVFSCQPAWNRLWNGCAMLPQNNSSFCGFVFFFDEEEAAKEKNYAKLQNNIESKSLLADIAKWYTSLLQSEIKVFYVWLNRVFLSLLLLFLLCAACTSIIFLLFFWKRVQTDVHRILLKRKN